MLALVSVLLTSSTTTLFLLSINKALKFAGVIVFTSYTTNKASSLVISGVEQPTYLFLIFSHQQQSLNCVRDGNSSP